MYSLIDFDSFSSIDKFKDFYYTNFKNKEVIVLFNLKFISKDFVKKRILDLKEIKSKILSELKLKNDEEIKNNIKFGLIIELFSLDNFISNFINNLKLDFDVIIGKGGMNKINRYFIENTKIDFILDPYSNYYYIKKDFIHHFNIGLNQVLFNMMKQKNMGILLSLNFLDFENNLNKYTKGKFIGRVNKIIKLSNKFKVPILLRFLISNKYIIKNEKEIKWIYSLFNSSSFQFIFSEEFLYKTIKENDFKKSRKYICDGLYIE
jgi:RNase P/RNase MRP subunit p30